eukprot:gene26333-34449_t
MNYMDFLRLIGFQANKENEFDGNRNNKYGMPWHTIYRSGSIEKHEFLKAMRVLRVDLTSRVLEAVFDNSLGSAREAWMIAITRAVRRIFSSRRFEEGSQSAGRIKTIFAEIDSDNSGTIDQGEFAKAMRILRVDLTSREIQEVFDRFDRRGGGSIDYINFLELIGFAPTRTSSSSSSSEETNLLVEKIRRRLEDYAGSGSQSAGQIKAIFAEIDSDNSGTIDQGEFAKVFDRFDRRGSGSIDYMNFLELIGFAPTHPFSTPSSSSSSSEEVKLLVEKIRRRLEDYAGS